MGVRRRRQRPPDRRGPRRRARKGRETSGRRHAQRVLPLPAGPRPQGRLRRVRRQERHRRLQHPILREGARVERRPARGRRPRVPGAREDAPRGSLGLWRRRGDGRRGGQLHGQQAHRVVGLCEGLQPLPERQGGVPVRQRLCPYPPAQHHPRQVLSPLAAADAIANAAADASSTSTASCSSSSSSSRTTTTTTTISSLLLLILFSSS